MCSVVRPLVVWKSTCCKKAGSIISEMAMNCTGAQISVFCPQTVKLLCVCSGAPFHALPGAAQAQVVVLKLDLFLLRLRSVNF